MVKVRDHKYQFISARPFAPNLGAEIYDVDLSKKISDEQFSDIAQAFFCLLYTSPSPRDRQKSRMPSSA